MIHISVLHSLFMITVWLIFVLWKGWQSQVCTKVKEGKVTSTYLCDMLSYVITERVCVRICTHKLDLDPFLFLFFFFCCFCFRFWLLITHNTFLNLVDIFSYYNMIIYKRQSLYTLYIHYMNPIPNVNNEKNNTSQTNITTINEHVYVPYMKSWNC